MKYEPITVSELNTYIKGKIEEDEFLEQVLVKGEISNFKHHYTGHMYFTLKDENCLIKCVMFKTYTNTLNFVPKDGAKVMVLGKVSVFERDGVYQIYVRAMQQDGIGDLYAEYEKLKARLEQEGLFAQEHKKKIPLMPKCIGVLTSNTGAVIRDIINVATRRNPNVYIKLLPVPVQGAGAAQKIVTGIQTMNQYGLADVIILARGGGSLEDLWPFNEEIVARAIYESEIPIISAVGHETDFTIADFVADLRAPTPSAAAELSVPNVEEIKQKIVTQENRYKQALKKELQYIKLRYEKCMNSKCFKAPLQKINEYRMMIDMNVKQIESSIQKNWQQAKTEMLKNVAKLDALSPLKTLTRGYVIVQTKQNELVKSVKQLKTGEEVQLLLEDGKKDAKIL